MRDFSRRAGESRSMWKCLVSLWATALFVLLASLHTPALAQLNENCVVSILTRTANVQPDGDWRIDNIPSNLGQLRVRATCVEEGLTRSGQSGFFEITPGVLNGIDGEISFDVVDPIAESLVVTSPITTLSAIGESAQLTVTATFPDGSTADATPWAAKAYPPLSRPFYLQPTRPEGDAEPSGTRDRRALII